jgi:glutamine synthetase
VSTNSSLADLGAQLKQAGVHTVEVGIADTYGHLRGKRVPVDRFLSSVAIGGLNMADAIFVFDIQCDIVDSPIINMGTGYLDMHLTPDLSSLRTLGHRPGYALVFADAVDEHDQPHALSPREVLRRQVHACHALGVAPIMATELEAYICTADWQPYQQHVQYSSLTDAQALEDIVAQMRHALLAAGIPLESSNPEYGPGQLEINFGPADPITTADNTVLFKSIVKEVAVRNDVRASFMPKPWTGQSGSGLHIHSSLNRHGVNVFGPGDHEGLTEDMAHWTAGILHHAEAMSLIGMPTLNGFRRPRPYTFCPTHVSWGEDNRTVMARCTLNQGVANRVEYRAAGADANPYLALAAVLAAGVDGLTNKRALPPMATGDTYTEPGDLRPLPASFESAIAAYRDSALSEALGTTFSTNFVVLAEAELAKANDAFSEGSIGRDPDEVSDWERRRYLEHT